MKRFGKTATGFFAFLTAATALHAATTVSVPTGPAGFQGFMNVFNIPQNGGAYQFGQAWGTADLRATFSGSVLSLACNTIGDPNPYWYNPSGGPGAIGNKIMDANFYNETTGVFQGQTLTFQGQVLANNLVGPTDALGNGWTAVAFIKDFAPDYSSSFSQTVPLTPGNFSVSLSLVNDPARHVQYGFEVIGPDVWAGDPLTFNSIQIVPEPSSIALLGLGCLGTLVAARRRK
jgi:hypothetical protein